MGVLRALIDIKLYMSVIEPEAYLWHVWLLKLKHFICVMVCDFLMI